jgi:hypothetical protein
MKCFSILCARTTLAMVVCAVFFMSLSTHGQEPPIDPARGRLLMQKSSGGETLTPEEQAYLERVKQEIRKRAAGSTIPRAQSSTSKPRSEPGAPGS